MRTILTLVNMQAMKNIVLPLGVSKSEQFRYALKLGLGISRTSFWRLINQKKDQVLGWEILRTWEFKEEYEMLLRRVRAMGLSGNANHLRLSCTALFDIGSVEIQLNLDLSARVLVQGNSLINSTPHEVARELSLVPKNQTPLGLAVYDVPLELLLTNLSKRKPRALPYFMGF